MIPRLEKFDNSYFLPDLVCRDTIHRVWHENRSIACIGLLISVQLVEEFEENRCIAIIIVGNSSIFNVKTTYC